MERTWNLALLAGCLLGGCAAQTARPPADDVSAKQEALEGAPCTEDAQCDAWEYCDRILCIPEAGACPARGACRATTRFYDNESTPIPDADPAGVARVIRVERPAANVARLHVSATLRHTWRGDLRVVLVSPSGTERVLHDQTGGSEDDLTITTDVTDAFEGESAVGDWTLVVSDHARRDTGRIATWRLEFDFAEPAPSPEPGRGVWSQVVLPSTESDHPYANDFDRTWDLRPLSAGATRARVHFARLDVERGYDFVEILDLSTGEVLDRFTGDLGEFTTGEYPTGDLGVRLVTDHSVTGWGFHADRVEVFGLGCLEDADCGDGFQCPTEVVRCIRHPCFLSCVPAAPGGEGDACAADADCAEGLFCGTGGACLARGACDVVADCDLPGNSWIHPLCVGRPTCDGVSCGWACDTTPAECAEGDTRDDGCNTCTCAGGRWACTERFCPPVGGPGSSCGAGSTCDAGLTCDRGPTDGASCVSSQPGVCEPGPEARLCPAVYAPVCSCTGQTFQNDCARIGLAPWAHEGACALDVAIPDADVDGVTRTVDVLAPVGARRARIQVQIDHTWRGDLVVWADAPDGSRHVLTNREGRSDDDFVYDQILDVRDAIGTWTLHVSDRASQDRGVLRFFNVLAQ